MPFIGSQPAVGFAAIAKDDLTADGSTTAFTLSRVVGSANDIAVFVGNVRQEPTDAYTISGTTLTMSAAPASGLNFYVLHLGGGIQSSTVPAAGTTVPGDFGVGGQLTVDNDGATVAIFDRATDDGTIVEFQKDGTTVGSIGYTSDGLQVNGEANHTGFRFGSGAFVPQLDGSDSDGTQNLGNSSARWEDLYLSGGVYLGGTGSANYLEDYEEGTWTVTFHDALTGGNTSNTTVTGYYTKIGRQVTASFNAGNIDSTGMTGSSNFFWSAPFTAGPYADQTMGSVRLFANVADSTASLASQIADNNSRGVITESRDATTLDNPVWNDFVDDASDVTVTITYFV